MRITPQSSVDQHVSDNGFTLMELLVVMVVLSLIAAAVTPQVMGRLDRSKVRAAKIQMETLSASVDMFRIDTGRYPTEQEGLKSLITQPADVNVWDGPYVRTGQSVVDPWDRLFIYKKTSNGKYILSTFGADGASGGEGFDTDLSYPDFTIPGSRG